MEILKHVYGPRQVSTLHIEPLGKDNWRAVLDNKEVPLDEIALRTKVIHGHSSFVALKRFVELPQDVPIITWLRDPVERVESAYSYASQIYKNEVKSTAFLPACYLKLVRFGAFLFVSFLLFCVHSPDVGASCSG